MKIDQNQLLQELEEKVKLLMSENDNLASRAEEIYLLSLVSESIHGITDPEEIIETVLEKISILKDLPFCGFGEIEDNRIHLSLSYASYSNDINTFSFCDCGKICKEIKKGLQFLKREDYSDETLFNELDSPEFKPESILIIPYKSESRGMQIYFFADDDENPERLRNMIIMLQESIVNLNVKLDNIYLINQFKELTLTLEKRISKRTSELWETNNLLRAQIKETEKTDDALRTKNDELNNFVYRVSHDLRAPIISVEGLINIIKLEEMDHESHISGYIGMLEDRVKNLDRFIRDILSYSRNINTRIKTDFIDFENIIHNCFEELTYLDGFALITKDIDINGIKFYNDKVRIYEIFRNLISNAIKYSNPDVENSWLKLNIDVNDDEANIYIEDNGIGISKSVMPNIFDMFYRGSEESKGSGIGLYIVRQAIDKLGGSIKVESDLNIGTKFNLIIPNHSMNTL